MADAPSARDRLDDALGATAPDSVRALPDDVLDRLVDADRGRPAASPARRRAGDREGAQGRAPAGACHRAQGADVSARRAGSPQLARIARLVHTDIADLDDLAGIDDTDLRTLHDQIAESYFGAGRESFARVAGLSKALPGAVAGKLAQRFLPPHLAAQVAVLLEPAKARELVSKVSLPYLADLSLSLDPTRATPILQAVPAERIGEVAAELFRRGDYAAVAEFAGSVTRAACAPRWRWRTGAICSRSCRCWCGTTTSMPRWPTCPRTASTRSSAWSRAAGCGTRPTTSPATCRRPPATAPPIGWRTPTPRHGRRGSLPRRPGGWVEPPSPCWAPTPTRRPRRHARHGCEGLRGRGVRT